MVLPPGSGPDSGHQTTIGSKTMSSIFNPFSIRNNQPKWPDGLASYSIGRKNQYTSEVYGKDLVFAFFPGLLNWCQVYYWDEDANVFHLVSNHHKYDNVDLMYEFSNDLGTGTNDNHVWRNVNIDPKYYESWRPVSLGLRIECVNNDEDNDGWFEAIRTNRDTYRHRLGIIKAGTGGLNDTTLKSANTAPTSYEHTDLYHGMMYPATMTVQEWYSARNWALHPSYSSGKLKDIGDYIFTLNQTTNDNEFIKLRALSVAPTGVIPQDVYRREYDTSSVTLKYTIPPVWGTSTAVADTTNYIPVTEVNQETGTTTQASLIPDVQKLYISDAFDMILIRVHGLDNTRLMLQSVQNIELTCGERSPYLQFTSVSYPNKEGLAQYLNIQSKQRETPYYRTETGLYFV